MKNFTKKTTVGKFGIGIVNGFMITDTGEKVTTKSIKKMKP